MSYPEILIVREQVSKVDLQPLRAWHIDLIKGVADLERKIIALGGEWHMDANNVLLADGFNIYPGEKGDAALAYESLINIRPAQGNKTMTLIDPALRVNIKKLVQHLIPDLPL
jgi:hypothetical protein